MKKNSEDSVNNESNIYDVEPNFPDPDHIQEELIDKSYKDEYDRRVVTLEDALTALAKVSLFSGFMIGKVLRKQNGD